ncbi:MAG TPA: acyltransferase [Acidimicrobiia bacterium]|jgi:peptidoglycan/LPS O-acetylase OafA/YrhL|nr:acyltransferase [Acidimicrobiia bacterium]
MPAAGSAQPTGERQRIVWWAHVARGSAALVVLFARFMFEFREQKTLVKAFTFITPISLAELPTSFAYDLYVWPRDHLDIDPGTAAVGMFFMLSGFVIPFALERRTMSAFGIRRILRVYPTLWVATALSLVVIWITTHGSPFPIERAQVITSGTLVAQYGGKNWIDPSYWTIPIEELFYLTAAILAATRLLRRPAVLVGTAALVTAVSIWAGRALPTPDKSPDVLFWTRFYIGRNLGFMVFIYVGVALHMLYRGFWTRRMFALVTGSIISLAAIALHHGAFQQPYLPVDQATTYFNSFVTGFVIFMIFYCVGNRIPRTAPLQILGDMSYPVYLTVTVVGWTILAWLTRSFGSYFLALPAAAAAVLGTAYLLHRFVEKPTYALAQRITAQARFRSDRSWSDEPRARRRRRARHGRPGYVPELDPDRAPESLPEPASAMLGLDASVPDRDLRTSAAEQRDGSSATPGSADHSSPTRTD